MVGDDRPEQPSDSPLPKRGNPLNPAEADDPIQELESLLEDVEDDITEMPSDDSIEERFGRIREQLQADALTLSEIPSEIDGPLVAPLPDNDKLAELDRKAEELRKRAGESKRRLEVATKRDEKTLRSEQEAARGLGFGLQVAYTIIGMPLLGAAIGYGIDFALKTTIWKGNVSVLFMAIGVGWAIYILQVKGPK
jgi:F0F1-type ATP synthase assembly protein I